MKLIKKDILWRVYTVYTVVVLFVLLVVAKVIIIQTVEGEEWKKKAEHFTLRYENIEAARGNIYSRDGSLLATSVPTYEIRMDVNADGLTRDLFYRHVDSLSWHLSEIFRDKSHKQYQRELIGARKSGERYHLIQRSSDYNQLKALRNLPLFRFGKYKGGFIYVQRNKRIRPFQKLAARTIGYDKGVSVPVGLEGAFSKYLAGEEGKRLMQKMAGGEWKPINDGNEIEPQDGADIITTIDINFQDVAERALEKVLKAHNADHGCAVLMEVATGEVCAIANLTMNQTGDCYEYYNYALGESTEPGSTFKLASVMAAFEDGLLSPDDSVDTEDGTTRYYDRVMTDAKKGGMGVVTVEKAFEMSSNVGISKIVYRCYREHKRKFVDRLHRMNLDQKLNLSISGEGRPKIKEPGDKDWSGTTLAWMSIGYEVMLTPLQMLAFYNAVANDGRMVKPRFVREISRRGQPVKTFPVETINRSICSRETLKKAKEMLVGVVESGTARNLRNDNYSIAGKTGTAQIANEKYGYKYKSRVSYQASFVGFFPADKPKYSCIVVINSPSNSIYTGNLVAGPVFKEIADKVYAGSIDMHGDISLLANEQPTGVYPHIKDGYAKDVLYVLRQLDIKIDETGQTSEWINTSVSRNGVNLCNHAAAKKLREGMVPSLVGMDPEDSLYMLENSGLRVEINGSGMIRWQSLLPGSFFSKGMTIRLELST